jgi:hypothetical protein
LFDGFLLVCCAALTPGAAAADVEPTDPLGVVDGFLAARNARDPVGAVAWCAALLSIDDSDAPWIADSASITAWLRRLTDAYLVDTLVPPHANGDEVAWSERLTPRWIPFPEALESSVTVDVRVVVQAGRITSYAALYPDPFAHSSISSASVSALSTSPLSLFVGTALALVLVAVLAGRRQRVSG